MAFNQFRLVSRFVKSASCIVLFLILGLIFSAVFWKIPTNIFRSSEGSVTVSKSQDTIKSTSTVSKRQSSMNTITDGRSQNTTPLNGSRPTQVNGNDVTTKRSDIDNVTDGSYTSKSRIIPYQVKGYESTKVMNLERSSKGASAVPPVTAPLFLTIKHDMGRLGNRMFEYAMVLGLGNATGRHAFVNSYKSSPDLTKLFLLTRVEEHTIDKSWAVVGETKYAYFDPIFKSLPDHNVKITGYVQSWKYFDNIRNTIRKEFTLLPSIRADVDRRKQDILLRVNVTDPVFVGVHVRQKDKESTPNTLEAPKSFFTNAMDKMRSLLKGFDVIFLVAGNNHKWCLDNFNETDVVVLPLLEPEVHFALLSSCQHGIVSVGSFGWWTAWLTGGQVIFYKKFPASNTFEYKGFVYEDYYPPHWIPLDD